MVLVLPCIDPLSSSLVYYFSEYERKSISTERYTVLAQKWECSFMTFLYSGLFLKLAVMKNYKESVANCVKALARMF